ncbi:MAG: bifunctional diaminohydroxyphosphoribosylaminopyrimidine deaminase/5-amino-6-(5-phosphoribosylamino)uracil reductase RibD [Chromatiales bacterium]
MAVFTADDHRYMAHALRLAARGLYGTRPNPRVGCLLVRENRIVGEGWHERAGGPHAELVALRQAGAQAAGAICYVTLEPCCHHGRTPPCTDPLIAAGIARVVAAMADPNSRVGGNGLKQLAGAGITAQSGLLAAESEALNVGFCQRMRIGRPWVRAKVAMSLDGRIAMATGESRWITSEAARRDVQKWRAQSGAIMTGVGTVLADDPGLCVRDPELLKQIPDQPLRVIVDSRLRIPPTARLLAEPGAKLVVTATGNASRAACIEESNAEVLAFPGESGRVDLAATLRSLGSRGINEMLVEAGPTLTGALLAERLVDELICYIAPKLLGDAAQGMARLPGLQRLADAVQLDIKDVCPIGPDLRLLARPSYP